MSTCHSLSCSFYCEGQAVTSGHPAGSGQGAEKWGADILQLIPSTHVLQLQLLRLRGALHTI